MSEFHPNPVDLHVGARIRARRRSLGISQEALAADLGLTFQQVQKYERGTNRVSASKLHAVATALDCPVQTFFDGLPSADQTAAGLQSLPDLANLPYGRALIEAATTLTKAGRKALVACARALANERDDEGAPLTTPARTAPPALQH